MPCFLQAYETLIEDSVKRFNWVEVLEHTALILDISSAVPLSWKID